MKDIRNIVMERLSCSEKDAVILCDNLKKIDSTLVPVLHRWIDTGDRADATTYRGYSIDTLCSDYGMNFIAALLTVDWIIKEPEAAVLALQDGIE